MIPMSFINPLSDEGKQIVRKDGGNLDRIFDENITLIDAINSIKSQEISDDKYIPRNYADLVIKRVEWYIEKKNDPGYNYKKYAFLFNPQITKFDVIAFYILCQAVGIKFGPNSRESRAVAELQGQIIENRLEELYERDRLEVVEKIMNNLIVQDKIKWTTLADLLGSKKINLQDLVLKNGEVILDWEEFMEYFGDVVRLQQPERMYEVFIGTRIKELIMIKMIMQNTENYIKNVHEIAGREVEPNSTLLKIGEEVTEALSKEMRYYGTVGDGGGEIKASPLDIEKFPPCIKKALDGIKSGGRNEVIVLFLTPFLSYARLYPSVFRRNATLKVSDVDKDLKITENEILPMIHDAAGRCSPPLFDDQPQEKININAKLGFGMQDKLSLQHEGETTWYTPMSCEKVKLNMPSLCKPDKTCKGITNPLSYYNRKMREK